MGANVYVSQTAVAGFLGVGARSVMVSMDALHIVREHGPDEIFVVFTSTREELE